MCVLRWILLGPFAHHHPHLSTHRRFHYASGRTTKYHHYHPYRQNIPPIQPLPAHTPPTIHHHTPTNPPIQTSFPPSSSSSQYPHISSPSSLSSSPHTTIYLSLPRELIPLSSFFNTKQTTSTSTPHTHTHPSSFPLYSNHKIIFQHNNNHPQEPTNSNKTIFCCCRTLTVYRLKICRDLRL